MDLEKLSQFIDISFLLLTDNYKILLCGGIL